MGRVAGEWGGNVTSGRVASIANRGFSKGWLTVKRPKQSFQLSVSTIATTTNLKESGTSRKKLTRGKTHWSRYWLFILSQPAN
jgi:hypothetical protein